MTSRQLFEYALIELNKVQAPSLILEDYNYFINKAVNQYINKVYNLYDSNQQKSDDLRVLKSSTVLIPYPTDDYGDSALFNKTYDLDLPDDYLHVLNCVVEYTVNKNFKCYDANDKVHFGAKRLTADMFSQIINNYYMRPSYKNPYFYINNVNISNTFPTSDNQVDINANKITVLLNEVGDIINGHTITINGITYTFKDRTNYNNRPLEVLCGQQPISNLSSLNTKLLQSTDPLITRNTYTIGKIVGYDLVVTHTFGNGVEVVTEVENTLIQKEQPKRYGNKSKVRMEIRYGKDDSLFKLQKVYIDYLKSPQFIRLTQDQVDEVEDNSQILEFPDYVCQEITNELIKLLMENGSDPRLQTNIPVTQTIANPAQEQQKR